MTHRLTKDEKLVLEGRRVKMTLAQAQATSKDRCSVDWLSTTIKGTDLFNSLFWTLSNEHHEGEFVTEVQVMAIQAKKVAAITGFQMGDLRPGRNYYDSTLRILNDEGEEVSNVSSGGVYQRDTYLIMLNGSGCTFPRLPGVRPCTTFWCRLTPGYPASTLPWTSSRVGMEASKASAKPA